MNISNVLLMSTLVLMSAAFFITWRWQNVRPALFWGLGYACWAGCYIFPHFSDSPPGSAPAMLSETLFLSSVFFQMHGLQDRAGEARFALRTRIAIWIVAIAATCWLQHMADMKWVAYSTRLSMRVALTGLALFVLRRHLHQRIDQILFVIVVLMTLVICVLATVIIHASFVLGGAPTPPDIRMVSQIIGNVISIAFGVTLLATVAADVMQRYRVAAMRDSLTDLPNRRQFDASLRKEWRNAASRRQPLSLLLVDVDLFKLYNDTHGHAAGDRCLVEIAAAIRGSVRQPGELCARLGGEEFVVLLPRVTASEALVVAERVRRAVESAALPLEKSPYGVATVSVGTATITPTNNVDPAFFEAADEALYRAKKLGRNRIEAGVLP